MRIGIDARLWSQTGVGRYTRNLVRYLGQLDKKNQYFLLALKQDCGIIKSQLSNLNYDNFKVFDVNIKWHSFSEQIKFPGILNSCNLDLVHFPYFSVPIFYNKPFVVTIHDLILHHFPTGEASTLPLPLYRLKLSGYKFVISQAAKKANKIIVVSKSTKNEIIDHLGVPEEKVEVIYEGVDDRIQNSEFRIQNESQIAKDQRPKTNRYFLYVGNAYPHKNLERLLEAFQKLKTQNSKLKTATQNLKLILVGKEDYFYKSLKDKVSEMQTLDSVRFCGQVNDGELRNLYKNAKALIIPSLMEGFSLPALEAMANKCLVLASSIPSLKEVCREDAIYFDPYDIDDMAEKMKMAYLGKFDKKIIGRGFERSKEFSFRKMAKETLKIYEQAININNK